MKTRYLAARSLDEALDHLDRYGEVTRILAGGTDLMIVLRSAYREGKALPDFLLDVSELPDCRTIREEGGEVDPGVRGHLSDTGEPPDHKTIPAPAGRGRGPDGFGAGAATGHHRGQRGHGFSGRGRDYTPGGLCRRGPTLFQKWEPDPPWFPS